jgi:hypothetical protein
MNSTSVSVLEVPEKESGMTTDFLSVMNRQMEEHRKMMLEIERLKKENESLKTVSHKSHRGKKEPREYYMNLIREFGVTTISEMSLVTGTSDASLRKYFWGDREMEGDKGFEIPRRTDGSKTKLYLLLTDEQNEKRNKGSLVYIGKRKTKSDIRNTDDQNEEDV